MRGAPASPGVAVGRAYLPFEVAGGRWQVAGGDPVAALQSAAARLDELSTAATGPESEILAAGAMIARDPALTAAVEKNVEEGVPPAQALLDATETFAKQLEAIDDATLAARAED